MGYLVDEDGVRELAAILPEIGRVFEAAMIIMKEPSRKGAALTIMSVNVGHVFSFTTFVGLPAEGKRQKYWDLSVEKAERLLAFRRHLSSFQSKDEKRERWAGAIRTENLIIGISGFPELWDEAIALALAVVTNVTTIEQATHIASLSKNPHLKRLMDVLSS